MNWKQPASPFPSGKTSEKTRKIDLALDYFRNLIYYIFIKILIKGDTTMKNEYRLCIDGECTITASVSHQALVDFMERLAWI